MQQLLPFTVLKRAIPSRQMSLVCQVATALTVYGIETLLKQKDLYSIYGYKVATALTVYGIETFFLRCALVITTSSCNSSYRLRY